MKTVLYISIFLVSNFIVRGKEPLTIRANYLVDKESSMKHHQVNWSTSVPFNEMELVKLGYNSNDAIWIKLHLKNSALSSQKVFLCFDNIHIDSLELYGDKKYVLGDRTRTNSDFLTALVFPIELNGNTDTSLVFRLKKGISFVEFSFEARSQEELMKETRQRTLIVSFFLGIVFLLIMLNGILWYSTRKKLYLYYLFYSVLTGTYVLIATGMMKYYFLPTCIYFSEIRIYIASFWFIILGLFLSDFMKLDIHQPKIYRAIYWSSIVNLLLISGSLFFLFTGRGQELKIFTALAYTDYLLVIVLIIVASIRHLRIIRSEGIYVLFAFLPMILWVVVFILSVFGFLPREPKADWLAFGSLYEVFLFGFILARNYIAAFQEESRLQKIIVLQKEEALKLVNKVQIKERIELSHLIHDKFGSSLYAVRAMLQKNDSKGAEQLVLGISEELRNLSHNIMPIALEEGAFLEALSSQIEIIQKGAKQIKIHLRSYDLPQTISVELGQPLYLIALELIHNAMRHGKASEIVVEIYVRDGFILLQVHDNGLGFEMEDLKEGFGIQAIKSRVYGFGGEFEIYSEPGEGTQVLIQMPFINTH